MNGVRRLLGGGSQPPQPPPPPQPSTPVTPPSQVSSISLSKLSWPPQDSPPASPLDSKPTSNGTPGLVIRKEPPKPAQVVSPTSENPPGNTSFQSPISPSHHSPTSSASSHPVLSPTRKPAPNGNAALPGPAGPSSSRVPPPRVAQPTRSVSNGWKRTSGLVNLRDELLMSLLTSEAVVDSRECEILSAEEVEELKKEHHVLKIRLTAMHRKLELETKIRDAALSLSKVNAAHRKVSKQTEEQLAAAERKVATVQTELWRVSERTTEVYRKLLEHRAGILGYSVHKMEKKIVPGMNGTADVSGAVTPNRTSTISSVASCTPSTPSKFDGAHLFAGHADAQIPKAPLSASEIATLEANLRAATESLNAANKKNADLARELSHLRLEKEQLETTMTMELQNAEETVAALEMELPRFEEIQARCDQLTEERARWEEDRTKLATREREVERLEGRLEVLEEKSGVATEMEGMMATIQEKADAEVQRKEEELSALKEEYEEARANWEVEKDVMEEDHLNEVATIQEELEQLRGGGEAREELHGALEALHTLMQLHEVDHTPRDPSLQGLLASLGTHLEKLSRAVSDHRAEIRTLRQYREEARQELETLDFRVKELSAPSIYNGPPIEFKGEVADVIALLQPVWAVLPAPELRAPKLTTSRHLRAASSASTPTTPSKMGLPSLSDVDIRALKALYDAKSPGAAVGGQFSLEAFAARVQALVIDDRSLIERLIRFAQAHDLLKKNAERAQKLAEDSSAALEMYQKQVAQLDDQNFALQQKQTALSSEIQELKTAIERATAERRTMENRAADQAEMCRQLAEANSTLSAKALSLAEQVASAPEKVRNQMEGQLAECQAALREAQEELEAMRTLEQTQRIALLDELNSMQTENANLMAQLRVLKK